MGGTAGLGHSSSTGVASAYHFSNGGGVVSLIWLYLPGEDRANGRHVPRLAARHDEAVVELDLGLLDHAPLRVDADRLHLLLEPLELLDVSTLRPAAGQDLDLRDERPVRDVREKLEATPLKVRVHPRDLTAALPQRVAHVTHVRVRTVLLHDTDRGSGSSGSSCAGISATIRTVWNLLE